MRIRYRHRRGEHMTARDYDVLTQDKPRGRWVTAGWVSGFGGGPGGWCALGTGADSWGPGYRATRAEAVRDMLAGRTFRSPEGTMETVRITVGTTTGSPEDVMVGARDRDISDDAMDASWASISLVKGPTSAGNPDGHSTRCRAS